MKSATKILFLTLSLVAASCTNLDETLYSEVDSSNFYNTKKDVLRAVFRPFEHGFYSVQNRYILNEITADQLVTVTRDGWWDDGGKHRMMQYHQYDVETNTPDVGGAWTQPYTGIGQCNSVIEDLAELDRGKYGFSQAEWDNLSTQVRMLRAWFYLNLLDQIRNVLIVTHFHDASLNPTKQASPKETFEFIESELLDCIQYLPKKTSLGGNGAMQGQWTQAGAAALLVRLYLNAEVYIGESRWDECETYAKRIIDGTYGVYALADRWDAAFDWDNDLCDEVIFGFPSTQGAERSFWHYDYAMYWWTVPSNMNLYLKDSNCKSNNLHGNHICQWAAAPSYNTNGKLYDFELGMPMQNYRKYAFAGNPGQDEFSLDARILDERMKFYKNLGNSRREGMLLYGYIEYDNNGVKAKLKSPSTGLSLYLRDACGQFGSYAPGSWPGGESTHKTGDHNSCYCFVKYPLYSDSDAGQNEADLTEIRLPEIIYALAECRLRKGYAEEAGTLLNSVRKRNYKIATKAELDQILYEPEGSVKLDEKEMLAEWGREFFAEGRRRIDPVRFGKFNSGIWWDKLPDDDDHTAIFPLTRKTLNTNHNLVQNPGYSK